MLDVDLAWFAIMDETIPGTEGRKVTITFCQSLPCEKAVRSCVARYDQRRKIDRRANPFGVEPLGLRERCCGV